MFYIHKRIKHYSSWLILPRELRMFFLENCVLAWLLRKAETKMKDLNLLGLGSATPGSTVRDKGSEARKEKEPMQGVT